MKCILGLGSNLGDRLARLEHAATKLKGVLRASPVFETQALVPPDSPADWNKPYLNAVIEIEWKGSARDLFERAKSIESELGRVHGARWAPREIDIDLLRFGGEIINEHDLRIPHPEMLKRPFVLSPLKHLDTSFLPASRALGSSLPVWMGILNVTPDSFSGCDGNLERIREKSAAWLNDHVQILDLGAESTRPGAQPLSPTEEWIRLEPVLNWLREHLQGRIFRPWISIDTYRARTARLALEHGADIINDVSGLRDPEMLTVLNEFPNSQYVLMHSLSVPADPKIHLQSADPVEALMTWARDKIRALINAGISSDRILFDPGIGFGKTALQSLELIKRIDDFFELNVRLLCGHSRKSFLSFWGERPAGDREWESAGVSLRLAERGVDVLRVHEPLLHRRAHRAFKEAGR